jgi:hypothetical protein
MSDHERYKELLPLYVAGQLGDAERAEIQGHLSGCADCRADHSMWREVSAEISTTGRAVVAPLQLADCALERIHVRLPLQAAFLRAWQLLRAQALLVHHELWPACAAVMAIGVVVALLVEKESVIHFIAPMVAAASLAATYGPEHDPAVELALSTPTSPWKILLARLTLVSGYNLLLALMASLVLLVIIPPDLVGALILAWLGPLTFLSALALLLSLWIGTNNAVTVVYGLWLARTLQPAQTIGVWKLSPAWDAFFLTYRQFWQNSMLLLTFSLLLFGFALLLANRSERVFSQRMT